MSDDPVELDLDRMPIPEQLKMARDCSEAARTNMALYEMVMTRLAIAVQADVLTPAERTAWLEIHETHAAVIKLQAERFCD